MVTQFFNVSWYIFTKENITHSMPMNIKINGPYFSLKKKNKNTELSDFFSITLFH